MNLLTEKFCVLPWVSLEASPIGTVRPCCLAENELRDDTGAKFNLATAEFTAIQNCQDMQTLREQFLAGKQPETYAHTGSPKAYDPRSIVDSRR